MSTGGGQSTVTNVSEFKPPEYTQDQWRNYANGAQSVTDWLTTGPGHDLMTYTGANPFDSAGNWVGTDAQRVGQGQVANLNDMQNYAINNAYSQGTRGLYNSGVDGYLQNILNGAGTNYNFIANNEVNPYTDAINPYADQANPYVGTQNQYGGATNPAFEQMLSGMRTNAENTYNRTTGAQTDAAAAMGGAYGGSAYNELVGANQRGLQDSLNQQEASLRNTQYQRAGDYEQQRLNNALQYSDAGLNRATNAAESQLSRGYQGNEALYGRLNSDFNNMMGYEMAALGQMPAIASMQSGLNNQIANAGQLQNSYQQQVIDAIMGNQQQQLQAGLLPWDVWGSMLSRASGQGGSTLGTTAQSVSPWQTGIGLGLLGAGAYNAMR